MGGLAPLDPGRIELSPPHQQGRWRGVVRMAQTILVVPAQAGQGPAGVDDPGAARPGDRPLPLVEPQAQHARDGTPADLSGRILGFRLGHGCAKADRKRGPLPPRRGLGPVDCRAAPRASQEARPLQARLGEGIVPCAAPGARAPRSRGISRPTREPCRAPWHGKGLSSDQARQLNRESCSCRTLTRVGTPKLVGPWSRTPKRRERASRRPRAPAPRADREPGFAPAWVSSKRD